MSGGLAYTAARVPIFSFFQVTGEAGDRSFSEAIRLTELARRPSSRRQRQRSCRLAEKHGRAPRLARKIGNRTAASTLHLVPTLARFRARPAGAKAHYDCVKAFSETGFTEDLEAITVPVLFLHGKDDQIVPIENSAPKEIRLARDGTLKSCPGLSHRLFATNHEDDLSQSTDIVSLASFVQVVHSGMTVRSRDGAEQTEIEAVVDIAVAGWDSIVGRPD